MAALKQGQIFGRYTIERVLGEGGMGCVYRASDSALLRRVALKVLSDKDPSSKDKILREARSAASISHENAVTIFDIGEVDGVPYIAMEHIEGESLRAFIESESPPPVDRRVEWLASIARALMAAHDRGLVHRDVKPENVIVRSVDGYVKVLDFGIAQHHSTAALEVLGATLPEGLLVSGKESRVSGTPAYMAPEQLRGEDIDGRADQFAWGIVAYEVLTGEHPFPNTDLTKLVADLLSRDVIDPRLAEPDITERVAHVVMRALAKKPDDRFPTMTDLLLALGTTATAPPPPVISEPATSQPPPAVIARSGSNPRLADYDALTVTDRAVEVLARVSSNRISSGQISSGRISSANLKDRPSAPTNDEPAQSRTPWRAAAVVGSVLVAFVLVFVARQQPAKQNALSPTNKDASANTNAPTPVTSLPIPHSTKLDAIAAYRAGLQSARDGAGLEARIHFARAAELDPTMAGAQMWIAALAVFANRTQAARALDHAKQQRVLLTDREQHLLTALEPLLDRDPADLAASENALMEAAARFPGDAHIRLTLGIVRSARGEEAALTDTNEALKIDPQYVAAELVRGLAFESLGRENEALETYEKCVASHPASASCFAGELKLLSRRGECERVTEEARRWQTANPSDPEAIRQRAVFLSSRLDAKKSVVELLATSRSLLPTVERPRRVLVDEMALALLDGDLSLARKTALNLTHLGTNEGGLGENGEVALTLAEIYEELGRVDDAGKVAAEFLRRRELVPAAARLDQDPTPLLAARARAAALITDAEANKHRDDWLERWSSRGRSGERWLIAHAGTADTPEQASRALAILPSFQPLPALPDARLSASLGHTYLLAKKIDEAIPVLERTVADCGVMRAPVVHIRALSWLGDAYVARGDHDLACKTYGRALDRWDRSADARPVTVTRLLAAASAAKCPPHKAK